MDKQHWTTVIVENMPEHLERYVVARFDRDDGSLWFYGTYDDRDKALNTANVIDGVMLVTV